MNRLFLRTKGVVGLPDEFSDSGTEGLPFGHTPPAIEKGHESWEFNRVATRSGQRSGPGIPIKVESQNVTQNQC
jgi:hypothetical protein